MSSAAKRAPVVEQVFKLPLAVFAIGHKKSNEELTKQLYDAGIGCVFVKSEEDFQKHQSRPDCFAAFVDLNVFPDFVNQNRLSKRKSKCFYVAITKVLTTGQSAKLFSVGMADILTQPVHAFTFRSRARQLLVRFVQQFGMPADIRLPAGIVRPEVANPSQRPKEDTPEYGKIIRNTDFQNTDEKKPEKKAPILLTGT